VIVIEETDEESGQPEATSTTASRKRVQPQDHDVRQKIRRLNLSVKPFNTSMAKKTR
jgi:hypothetical protein